MSERTHQRPGAIQVPAKRLFFARLVVMLSLTAAGLSVSVNAQDNERKPASSGPYRGITVVEVFTNTDTQLRLPKSPPFELKVYRMDAFQAMNQALESKTPRGLTYDQKKAWQVEYTQNHKAEIDRWAEMVAMAMAGGERLKVYRMQFRLNPGVVINKGQWAVQGEPDLNKVFSQFHVENK